MLDAARRLGAAGVTWEPAAPGFSGAAVWRGGGFALKRWPANTSRTRLEAIHGWVRAASAELPFVPRPAGLVESGGFLWDLQAWMPGAADFSADPSDARLCAAATALGRLHTVWRRLGGRAMVSRAARERAEVLGNAVLAPPLHSGEGGARSRCTHSPLSPVRPRRAAAVGRHAAPVSPVLARRLAR